MRNGFLGALGLLVAIAIALLGACAPSSSGGGSHPADDDASPTDDDDNDTTPPADDDGSPADDDNDDSSPADDDDNDDDDSATDVFAVGFGGTILHYDGATWSAMTSGVTGPLEGVWGSSGSDVFAVENWGNSANAILHYDGSSWSSMSNVPDAPSGGFSAVWGSSPSDVFAVGYDSTENAVILHYDGAAWSVQWTAGASLGVSSLGSVWGSSASDVFVAGQWILYNYPPVPLNGGMVLNNNGGSWNAMGNMYSFDPLNAVWGASASDVFAVGYIPNAGGEPGGNVIMHYDGASWVNMAVPTQAFATVAGIWGASPTAVFAIGEYYGDGFVYRYDGSSWSPMTTEPFVLIGIWGSDAADIFVVGYERTGNTGVILHYDGSSWATMLAGSSPFLNAVWGVAPK